MNCDLKIFTENVEPDALNQIYALAVQPPFEGQKIRIMPDVHFGTGCVVGFTGTLGDKIIPNVLGVDLGCGMLCAELGKVDIDYAALDNFIKSKIPYGGGFKSDFPVEQLVRGLDCFKQLRDPEKIFRSLGTLGGGNHFIEVDSDADGNKYLVVHTGSRNLGLQVAKIYQKLAVASSKSAAEAERQRVISALKGSPEKLPEAIAAVNKKYAYRTKIPADMCFLDGGEMEAYMHDLRLCQQFACYNRRTIVDSICKFLRVFKYSVFETVHNYVDSDNIIRKGSIPAREGQRVLIPMNMRDGCLIAVGKGNPDWNQSAPHGAGRLCKRSEAKELFSVEEFKESMKGVYSTTVGEGTIDESPFVYKPMEEIIGLIGPTVDIEKIIKPAYNFKAGEE